MNIWEQHKDFFCPDNVVNEVAFNTYLEKYAQLNLDSNLSWGAPKYSQQQLLGIILKQAPDKAFETAFTLYYLQFRTGPNSIELDAWLSDIAIERPDLLITLLKKSTPHFNFTQQVMVLRDVQKLFPGSNIKDYADKKLLKTKPSVILKQFNPSLVDMPYLLAMSASLLKNEDPQSKALGDTIARGCFIAQYSMPLAMTGSSYCMDTTPPAAKYCSTEAFTMLVNNGIDMPAALLLEQVQLRCKSQCVMFDALAYPVAIFENKASSQMAQSNALDVFDAVMTFSEFNPGHPGFGTVVEHALSRLHAVLPLQENRQRIEQHMTLHMLNTPPSRQGYRDIEPLLSLVQRTNPVLLRVLVDNAFKAVDAVDQLYFLQNVIVNVKHENRALPFCFDYTNNGIKNAFFALLPTEKVEAFMSDSLRSFFDPTSTFHSPTFCTKNMLQVLSTMEWSQSNANAFRESPLASITILLYLYMAAAGHNDGMEQTHVKGIPNTDWEPLPFLKKIYPEKMQLWNQMALGLLQMPLVPDARDQQRQYQKIMGSMFQAFSQTFLADGPSLRDTQGVIESLEVNPLYYFIEAHKTKSPILSFSLPDDMFSFD